MFARSVNFGGPIEIHCCDPNLNRLVVSETHLYLAGVVICSTRIESALFNIKIIHLMKAVLFSIIRGSSTGPAVRCGKFIALAQ